MNGKLRLRTWSDLLSDPSNTIPMYETCRLTLGNRGSGKSEGLKIDLLRLAKEKEYAVVAFDAPGTLAFDMVGQLCAAGLKRRTFIEYASQTEKVLSWQFSPPSKNQIEHEIAVEQMAQAFYARRNEKGGENKPYTDRYLKAAVSIWRSQKNAVPVDWMLKIFQQGTQEHRHMMQNAADRTSVEIFHRIETLGLRSPVQYAIETGASERILQPVASPVVHTRNGDSINWEKMLLEKSQVYFDLSGVTADSARSLTILAYTSIINTCRAYFNEHKRPLPVVIVLEEAGALNLVTPFIITAMQELRKAGVFVWIVSQTILDFQDTAQFEQIMSLTDCHQFYRMNAGLERAAKDITTPTFDPLGVHYQRERQEHFGEKEVVTKSTGKSKDSTGVEREDERESITYRPVYRTVVDSFYKSYELQESEIRKEIATLTVGQRFVRDLSGVRKETVVKLPEPWPLNLTQKRTIEAIEEIRNRPCYQKPQTFSLKQRGKKGLQ